MKPSHYIIGTIIIAVILCSAVIFRQIKPDREDLEVNEYSDTTDTNLMLYGHRFRLDKTEGIVTKFNATVAQTDSTPFITASGERVREGIVACPVYLPFGTIVYIDGEQYVCKDRMNKRYQHTSHYDIFSWDIEEAKNWGRKYKIIEIIR